MNIKWPFPQSADREMGPWAQAPGAGVYPGCIFLTFLLFLKAAVGRFSVACQGLNVYPAQSNTGASTEICHAMRHNLRQTG